MKKLTVFGLVLALGLSAIAAGCSEKSPQTDTPQSGSQEAAGKSWSSAPAMSIDQNRTYQAVFETDKGKFSVDLFTKEAPVTVNNFVFLAEQNYYDGVKFHRIMQDFMIQSGDPTGTGRGGPGYTIEDELNSPYTYEPGIVAMANKGIAHTGGSQFFICTGESSKSLDNKPNFTIFGKVSAGMDVVQELAAAPVTANSQGEMSVPLQDVLIQNITIVKN